MFTCVPNWEQVFIKKLLSRSLAKIGTLLHITQKVCPLIPFFSFGAVDETRGQASRHIAKKGVGELLKSKESVQCTDIPSSLVVQIQVGDQVA